MCKHCSANKMVGLSSSCTPWLLVIQPRNGLCDSRAANKTHANVWPGSRVSPLLRQKTIVLKCSQPGPYSINGRRPINGPSLPNIQTHRSILQTESPLLSSWAASPPVAPGPPAKTSPHLLWAEGPFRRLLRKSRGVGKRGRGDGQRTEKSGERVESVKKERERSDREVWKEEKKIEGGGRGDEYCIRCLRVMAIVHVVY